MGPANSCCCKRPAGALSTANVVAELRRLGREQDCASLDRWCVARELGGSSAVLSLAFSPHGATLVTGDAAERLVVYEVATWKLIRALVPQGELRSELCAMAFSPDGAWLAACSFYRLVVYNTASWTVVKETDDTCDFRCVAFSPKSDLMAVGLYANSAVLYCTRTWKSRHSIALPTSRPQLYCLAFSPHGEYLAISGEAGKLVVHKTAPSWGLERALTGGGAVAFSPKGDVMIVSNYHYNHGVCQVSVLRTAKWDTLRTLDHTGAVWCLAFSPEGGLLAAGDAARRLTVYDADTWQVICALERPGDVLSVSFSACGLLLAAGYGGPSSGCAVHLRNDIAEAMHLRALADRAAEEAEDAARRAEYLKQRAGALEANVSHLRAEVLGEEVAASAGGVAPRRRTEDVGRARPEGRKLHEQQLWELYDEISRDLNAYCREGGCLEERKGLQVYGEVDVCCAEGCIGQRGCQVVPALQSLGAAVAPGPSPSSRAALHRPSPPMRPPPQSGAVGRLLSRSNEPPTGDPVGLGKEGCIATATIPEEHTTSLGVPRPQGRGAGPSQRVTEHI